MSLVEHTARIQTSDLSWAPVTCQYCRNYAYLTTGALMGMNGSNASWRYWRCQGCDAHVKCYVKGAPTAHGISCGFIPMGELANPQLRAARTRAHEVFDPFWKEGYLSRGGALRMFSQRIGFSFQHIGDLLLEECELIELVAPLLWERVRRHQAHKRRTRRRNPKYRIK